MNLRYWASFMVFSIMLHVALFWPLPAPPRAVGDLSRLIVTLPAVSQVDLHVEDSRSSETGLEPQLDIPRSGKQSKAASTKSVELMKQAPLPKLSHDKPPVVESSSVEPELRDGLVSSDLRNDPKPSISWYRLALAAEVIRTRASIETLVASDFKGRLIVLVQLRGPTATPQVSLDESAGSEYLDREVLAAFRRAAALVPVSIAGDVGDVSIRLPVHFDRAALD